ncbi:hypothetical protein [Ascidiimonas aurantiaca]|uniref:hypothetical protein n=1 Tax=Ascidiimonas aurantiaca TaxID=1685432 RepID=UPI0030EF2F0D
MFLRERVASVSAETLFHDFQKKLKMNEARKKDRIPEVQKNTWMKTSINAECSRPGTLGNVSNLFWLQQSCRALLFYISFNIILFTALLYFEDSFVIWVP